MTSRGKLIGLVFIMAVLSIAAYAPVLLGLVHDGAWQPSQIPVAAPYTFDGTRIVTR